MPEEIEQLGKGLLPQPDDPRDYNFAFIAAGAAPIDWSHEFRLSEPPDSNQRSSDGCVGFSTTSLHWQHKRKDYSRRDLFSRIALPNGAFLRDGVKTICKVGQQTQDECPDPATPTRQNMRIKSSLPDSAGMDDLEASYFAGGESIEQVAQAVRDFGGSVFGVYGNSAGWKDKTNPRPPVAGEEDEWAHAICAFGYHMHNGLKCIIAKSSWCKEGHHEHHIKEDYFAAGRVFNNWVLIPKENMPNVRRYRFEDHGTLGVALKAEGAFGFEVYLAKSEQHLARLMEDYEVPADAPVIKVP